MRIFETKSKWVAWIAASLLAFSVGSAMAAPPMQVTCGSAITAPGQYVLMADCMGAGIVITNTSDVHLKLNGHTMTGNGLPAGIGASNVSHVHIEGPGTIRSYIMGIFFGTVSDSHVEQVTVINNGVGLTLTQQTTNTHVNNSVFSMNATGGIHGDSRTSDNHLNNNQVINNNSFGILLDSGATNYHINGNTALGNYVDLADGNPNCDDNKWNGNTFVTASQPCIH